MVDGFREFRATWPACDFKAKSGRGAVGEIGPYPCYEDGNLISHAKERHKVYCHPCEPRDTAMEMYVTHIDEGTVSSDCCHGAFVTIDKRFTECSIVEVVGEISCRLDSYLGNLGMSVGILRRGMQRYISDRENIRGSLNASELIDRKAVPGAI